LFNNGLFLFCARKSDYELRRVARQLRITGLQADVQKENKIAEQLQNKQTGKKY
jgi:uncharacterized protein with PIN domain